MRVGIIAERWVPALSTSKCCWRLYGLVMKSFPLSLSQYCPKWYCTLPCPCRYSDSVFMQSGYEFLSDTGNRCISGSCFSKLKLINLWVCKNFCCSNGISFFAFCLLQNMLEFKENSFVGITKTNNQKFDNKQKNDCSLSEYDTIIYLLICDKRLRTA